MDTIKFANGAVHDCPYLATDPTRQTAYIGLSGVSYAEAAQLFDDPSVTSVMEWSNYRLVGYTELLYVMREEYGIKAALKGGHNELR